MTLRLSSLAVLAVAVLGVAGCGNDSRGGGSSSSGSSGGSAGRISLVAYSTPQDAYKSVIGAFQKTSAGKGATFSQSYGPSGDQARAVIAGLPADYVAFSLAPDMDKLVDEGLVDKDWTTTPTKGFVTNSVVTLVVRKGNPKHITRLERPAQAGRPGHHAERLLLGLGQVERHGRLRGGRQGRQLARPGQAVPDQALSSTSRSSPSRAATRCRPSSAARATS